MAAKWYNPFTWGKKSISHDHLVVRALSEPPKDSGYRFQNYREYAAISFGGEKNPGQVGPAVEYTPDHQELVVRGWQAMIESAPAKIAVNRRTRWVVGKGLKMQSEPVMEILEAEGIRLDKEKFTKSVEAAWKLFCKSKRVDWSGQKNFNQITKQMDKNSAVAGDVLVILRVIKGELKVQLVDAAHVRSPEYGSQWWPQELPSGHLIVDGVEMNEHREHVAYWVRSFALESRMHNLFDYKYVRVEAVGKKSGMRMAYLLKGEEFRIDTVRGMSRMATFIEKLTNLDLYSGATLKQAQESAKIDYQQVHEKDAPGTSVWANQTASALNGQGPVDNGSNPVTDDGVQKRDRINITGIGTAINNPPGSRIEMLENKNPLYFKDFNDTHRDEFFAGMEMPPNVAMSKYDDSYSASRAAVKDFEHTMVTDREELTDNGIKPVYDLWLDLEILQGRIHAPGYIAARLNDNHRVLEAYRNMRTVGPQVPHIDPLKEVMAAREKLGEAGAAIPLADPERVTEDLGMGDFGENLEQFAKDLNKSKALGVEVAMPQPQDGTQSTGKKKKKKQEEKEED